MLCFKPFCWYDIGDYRIQLYDLNPDQLFKSGFKKKKKNFPSSGFSAEIADCTF